MRKDDSRVRELAENHKIKQSINVPILGQYRQ